jgi:hypothetical protein
MHLISIYFSFLREKLFFELIPALHYIELRSEITFVVVDVDLLGCNCMWSSLVRTNVSEKHTSVFRAEGCAGPHCIANQETNIGVFTAVTPSNLTCLHLVCRLPVAVFHSGPCFETT